MLLRRRLSFAPLLIASAAGSYAQTALAAAELAAGAPADTFDIDSSFITGLTAVTGLRFLPDGRLLVMEKAGNLKIWSNGTVTTVPPLSSDCATTFCVDDSSEKGLLGVIAHPDFANNKRIIVYYSPTNTPIERRNRVSSFVLDGGAIAAASENIIVDDIEGPRNHDGGGLSLDRQGMLYVGTGDTGCNANIPLNDGPDPDDLPDSLHPNLISTAFNTVNGKVLRVDPNGTAPNSAPADNPFVSATANASGLAPGGHDDCAGGELSTLQNEYAARREIYATGFRNAFRLWVDPATDLVWVGDVGEGLFEEVNIVEKGKHYGWPFIEGPVDDVFPRGWPLSKCSELSPSPGNCVPPAYICSHGSPTAEVDGGCASITGGLIADSCTFPTSFRGKYFFGDNDKEGRVRTLDVNPDRRGFASTISQAFLSLDEQQGVVEITDGPDGALYVAALVYPSGDGPFPATSYVVRVSPKVPANDPNCKPPGSGGSGGAGGAAGAPGGSGAGVGGSGLGGQGGVRAGASGASGSNGGGGNPADPNDDDDGCGCRAVGGGTSSAGYALILGLGVSAALRRRRGKR